jgi:hypothetical protein
MQTQFVPPTTVQGQLAESSKVTGLLAADYHAALEVQSCSLLKPMLLSPAHYKVQFMEGSSKSKSKDFGTLVHTLVLEPHRLASEYAIYSGEKKDARDRPYKEFCSANPGLTVVHESSLHEARTLADKLLNRKVMGRLFGDLLGEAEKEVTIYCKDPTTGVRCRVRIDVRHPEFLLDLKTSVSVVQREWLRSAIGYHYDMQSYMYSLANCLFTGADRPLPFLFLVGESCSPNSVSVYTAGESFIARGGQKYQEAIAGFAACSATNHWPDLGEEATLEIEHWMAPASNEPAWRRALKQP